MKYGDMEEKKLRDGLGRYVIEFGGERGGRRNGRKG